MGDLPGKFPGRRASEDKARRKDPCWPVGTVVESDKQPLQISVIIESMIEIIFGKYHKFVVE